jgi:hypothetical protein
MALTDPIFRRNIVEGTTNLERSNGVRRRARDKNILLLFLLPNSDAAQASEVGVSSSFRGKSAARRSPMDVILRDWGNLKLTLPTATCQIGEGHSVVKILC